MVLVGMVACVPRKQRVETYLDRDTVDSIVELAKERGTSSSDVIRSAVKKELEREELEA